MFDVHASRLEGVKELTPKRREDSRGVFIKTFHQEFFAAHGMETHFAEQYYSFSKKGVLRGLHFQLPPADHAKLVSCISGEVLDVVLDLRKNSPTYGRHEMFNLSGEKASQLYIPTGFAHGFYVTSSEAVILYNVSSVYAPAQDSGILWNSAGIPWPEANPLLSDRDRTFAALQDFKSPFTMK